MSSQHNFPGVYPVITDLSQVVNSNSVTSCGYVGETEFGPINKPTLITSLRGYTEKFGALSSDFGYMGLSLAVAADTINSHYIVRVVDEESARYGATAVPIKGRSTKTIIEGYNIDQMSDALEDSGAMFIDDLGVDENSALMITHNNPNNRTIKITTADTTINTNKNIKAINASFTYAINNVKTENGGSGYAKNDTITFNIEDATSTEAIVKVTSVGENGSITGLEIVNSGVYTKNISGIIPSSSTSGSGSNALFSVSTKLADNRISVTISQEDQFSSQDSVIITDSFNNEFEGTVTTISDTYALAVSINAAGSNYNVGDVVKIGNTDISATITSVNDDQSVAGLTLNTVVSEINPGTGIYETTNESGSGLGLKVLLTVNPIHNVVNVTLENSESFIHSSNNIRILKQVPASEKTFSLSVYEVMVKFQLELNTINT